MAYENNEKKQESVYSKRIKAGKRRTYFFDVKSTKSNDYYLTITESKRRLQGETFVFEKHKIFLYKEDFGKFIEALQDAVDHVKNDLMPEVDFSQYDVEESEPELDDELKWE